MTNIKWKKPVLIQAQLDEIMKFIRVSAWSVDSCMSVGEFLDSQAAVGVVEFEFNPGHEVQVEVIGRIIVAGHYIATLIDSFGRQYKYRKSLSGGSWQYMG